MRSVAAACREWPTTGSANSGTETKDLFAFLKVCGRYAAPLPMAEILLANRWLGASAPAQGFASIGTQAGDSLVQVAWGRQVSPVLSVEAGSHDVSVFDAATLQQRGANLAGEPRDTMVAGAVSRRIELEDLPMRCKWRWRTNLMAGCLQAVLDLGLQFAAERSQFGRSISKFQAIQHSLAVVGTEVAASQRAADAGVDAMGTDRFEQEVAAAKAEWARPSGLLPNRCIRCTAPWVIPTNTAYTTLLADCGPGGTNGATSFTGRQNLANIWQSLARTGFGDISLRLVRSLFEYFGESRQPQFLVTQILVDDVRHESAIQGAYFMHSLQVSPILVRSKKTLKTAKSWQLMKGILVSAKSSQ